MLVKLLKTLFILVFIFLLSSLTLFFLVTTKQLEQHKQISAEDVNTAQQLASQSIRSLARADGDINVTIDQQQLNAIMSVASYALPDADFNGVITPLGVLLQGKANFQLSWSKRSVNLTCLLTPFKSDFAIGHCQLGKIRLPHWLANPLFKRFVHFAVAAPASQQLLDLFATGRLQNNQLVFSAKNLGPIKLKVQPQLYQPLNLINANQVKAPDIEYYLLQLQALQQQYPKERRLAFYIHKLLVIATERAHENSLDSAYHDAIWALAVTFANKRFIHYDNPNLTTRQIPRIPVKLIYGRHDLTLHFLYSSVLQILGTSELSQQVGNLKEIMDAGGKGSGFSFVDLAADRAGTHFAEKLNSINKAHLTSYSSEQFEQAIMPSIQGLPEGLTEQQVQQQFGGYNGEKFKQLSQEIELRVSQLSLYKYPQ
ncbi:hypothetical protein [Rheinheimera sp. WS51]|uniref:hypothetical protein n=1 Tax=Rheinheimera sp. WS51 TaxID=3425886 RepID=UPI003D89BA45